MKTRQVVLGLIALIGLGNAFGVGRHFPPPPPPPPPAACDPTTTRCIHVSVDGAGTGKCQVDSPVANLSYLKHEKVEWISTDQEYAVSFLQITPPAGSTPLPSGYVPESALAPPTDPVYFNPSQPAGPFNVKQKVKYYYYAIFFKADYPNKPCKVSTDERDTGLNVKQ